MPADPYRTKADLLRKSVTEGPALLAPATRQSAFANDGLHGPAADLVAQVHRDAKGVRDEQVTALQATHTEAEVFELLVAAASGAGYARLQCALAAIDAAEAGR